MSTTAPGATHEEVIAHGNEPFAIEVRGFDHIPEAERNMTLRQVDHLWVGLSVNLLSFLLGSMAITLGLNLWLALAACAVGNLLYAFVAFGSIVAVRAGLPVSTLSRAAFGIRGNLPNALLSWIASVAFEVINTVFGADALMALFDVMGWRDAGAAGKLLAVLVQLVLCGGIVVLGHATMVWFQKIFAALVGGALVVVFAFTVGKVDWAHAALPHAQLGSATVAAAFLTAMTMKSPLYDGPIATALGGADLSWLVGFTTSLSAVLPVVEGAARNPRADPRRRRTPVTDPAHARPHAGDGA